jgi:hypothetical protein
MASESQQITQMLANRYGTANYRNLQVVKWQYYDYVRSAPSATGVIANKLNFFSVPQGATDPNSGLAKTLEETNLDRNGQFTYDYVITAIRTHLQVLPKSRQNTTGALNTVANLNVGNADGSLAQASGTMNFLDQLSGRGSLIVNFGQKRYFEITQPFKTCPVGAGVAVKSYGGGAANDPAAANRIGYWYSQSADPRDVYKTTPPLFVERDSIIDASIQFLDTDYSAANYTLPNVVAASAGSKAFVNVGLIFDGFAIIPTQ